MTMAGATTAGQINVLSADDTGCEKVSAEPDELFNNLIYALLARRSAKANGEPRPFDRLRIVLDHKLFYKRDERCR